jgi:hypothetical protein
MTINLETEVETAYNRLTHVHSYTIARGGKRWTVHIPDSEFADFGSVAGASAATNKARRRLYLATTLTNAMQGAPDANVA